MNGTPRIEAGDWSVMADRVRPLRIEVFVSEQGVPEAMELDEHDPVSIHFAAVTDDGRVIGTARLRPDGHVGRMAVGRAWRGHGVGSRLLEAIFDAAVARGWPALVLAAQLHAITFYEKFGFEARGPVFDDAGLAHRWMRRTLD